MDLDRILKKKFSVAEYESFRKKISRQNYNNMKKRKLNQKDIELLASHFTAGDVLALLKLFYEKTETKTKINL